MLLRCLDIKHRPATDVQLLNLKWSNVNVKKVELKPGKNYTIVNLLSEYNEFMPDSVFQKSYISSENMANAWDYSPASSA